MLINRIVLTIVFVGIYSVAIAQNINALDENNGFQNYKFGMYKNDFTSCEDRPSGYTGRCVISRIHKINDIDASEVILFFIDSKLAKIEVHFGNSSRRSRLVEAIEAAFGSPTGRENYPIKNAITGSEINIVNPNEPQVIKWQADEVTLKHVYKRRFIGDNSMPILGNMGYLHLEFVLNNYDDLLDAYRTKKIHT